MQQKIEEIKALANKLLVLTNDALEEANEQNKPSQWELIDGVFYKGLFKVELTDDRGEPEVKVTGPAFRPGFKQYWSKIDDAMWCVEQQLKPEEERDCE